MQKWNRERTKKIPFIVPSKAYSDYEVAAGWYVKRFDNPINYKVNIKALYYMDKNYEKIKNKIDLTNLNEALHDILVTYGVLEDDCSRIIVSTDGSRVLYDKNNPRTEVHIERVKE